MIYVELPRRQPMPKVERYAFMAALPGIARSPGRIVYLGELYNALADEDPEVYA